MERELIYKIAERLEKVCKRRNAHGFYSEICKSYPDFFRKIHDVERGKTFEDLKFDKVDYSVGKMGTIVSDFLLALDVDLYEKLWGVLEDLTTVYRPHKPQKNAGTNCVSVREVEERGKTGKVIKKFIRIEIDLAPTDDVKGMNTVAHEYGHILEQRVQQKVRQRTDCLGEISSFFIEKLYADYLLKIGNIDETQYYALKKAHKQDFIANARIMLEEYEILSQLKIPITGEQLAKLEERYCGTKRYNHLKHRINEMINGKNGKDFHGEYVFRYIVGEVVSELMYQDFYKDPNETLKRYKQFLSCNAEIKREEAFEMLLGENYRQRMTKYLDAEKVKS